MTYAAEISRSYNLFNDKVNIRCTAPELSGDYDHERQFQAACYKHNFQLLHFKAIEMIGLMNKWALVGYTGRYSITMGQMARVLSEDFINFKKKPPEKQAEAVHYLQHCIEQVLPKARTDHKPALRECLILSGRFYKQYLEAYEPYNNPELCR